MNDRFSPSGELRLLIVDDDPGTLRLLIDLLKDLGRVHFATNGTAALDMIHAVQPDAILLDVEMPGMDGFELCRRIREDGGFADVPILFVTAHGDVEMETRALSAGAIDFIAKPPHAPVVRARVRNYLALRERTERLRRLSTVDGLTGIANRRAFDEALVMEYRRARRSGEPLSLLMCDVDHFKRFNDTYGHQAGDECLRAVAGCLERVAHRSAVGACAVAARYGGEEFAVLLPATPVVPAVDLARRAMDELAALMIPHSGSSAAPHVTISVGVACAADLPPSPRDGDGGDLVKAADRALYEAKGAGRNRVHVAGAASEMVVEISG